MTWGKGKTFRRQLSGIHLPYRLHLHSVRKNLKHKSDKMSVIVPRSLLNLLCRKLLGYDYSPGLDREPMEICLALHVQKV